MVDKIVQDIELEDADISGRLPSAGASLLKENFSIVGHVKAKAEVVFGSAEISIDELFGLKEGSVVALDQDVNAPVQLVVNGKVVAKGTLVVVGDRFALEITEIL